MVFDPNEKDNILYIRYDIKPWETNCPDLQKTYPNFKFSDEFLDLLIKYLFTDYFYEEGILEREGA